MRFILCAPCSVPSAPTRPSTASTSAPALVRFLLGCARALSRFLLGCAFALVCFLLGYALALVRLFSFFELAVLVFCFSLCALCSVPASALTRPSITVTPAAALVRFICFLPFCVVDITHCCLRLLHWHRFRRYRRNLDWCACLFFLAIHA